MENITITKSEYTALSSLLLEVLKRDLLKEEIGLEDSFHGPSIENEMNNFINRNSDQIDKIIK